SLPCVALSSTGESRGGWRGVFGACTALRLSPAPRFCMLRGMAGTWGLDVDFARAFRAGRFAFAIDCDLRAGRLLTRVWPRPACGALRPPDRLAGRAWLRSDHSRASFRPSRRPAADAPAR